jgi:hypothetical protein
LHECWTTPLLAGTNILPDILGTCEQLEAHGSLWLEDVEPPLLELSYAILQTGCSESGEVQNFHEIDFRPVAKINIGTSIA